MFQLFLKSPQPKVSRGIQLLPRTNTPTIINISLLDLTHAVNTCLHGLFTDCFNKCTKLEYSWQRQRSHFMQNLLFQRSTTFMCATVWMDRMEKLAAQTHSAGDEPFFCPFQTRGRSDRASVLGGACKQRANCCHVTNHAWLLHCTASVESEIGEIWTVFGSGRESYPSDYKTFSTEAGWCSLRNPHLVLV